LTNKEPIAVSGYGDFYFNPMFYMVRVKQHDLIVGVIIDGIFVGWQVKTREIH